MPDLVSAGMGAAEADRAYRDALDSNAAISARIALGDLSGYIQDRWIGSGGVISGAGIVLPTRTEADQAVYDKASARHAEAGGGLSYEDWLKDGSFYYSKGGEGVYKMSSTKIPNRVIAADSSYVWENPENEQ